MRLSRYFQPSSFNAVESPATQHTFSQMRRAAALAGSRFVKDDESAGAALTHLDAWASRLVRTEPLTVLEYTTLLYAARTGTISDREAAILTLRHAWQELTGLAPPENILEKRLPLYVLGRATHDERLFHVAVFHKDDAKPSRVAALRDFVPTVRSLPVLAGLAGACVLSPTLAVALAGTATALFVSSVAESVMHELVGHASPETMKKLERFPRIKAYVEGARYSHAVVHHGQTFKDYVHQFKDDEHHARVDQNIQKQRGVAHWKYIVKNRYGTSMGLKAAVQYLAPLTPFLTGAAALTDWNPAFIAGMVPALAGYPMYSAAVHDFFHKQMDEGGAQAGPLMRMYLKTPFARLTSRQHWDHHRGSLENMNLSPGAVGDLVVGTFVPLSVPKLLEVRRLGILR